MPFENRGMVSHCLLFKIDGSSEVAKIICV